MDLITMKLLWEFFKFLIIPLIGILYLNLQGQRKEDRQMLEDLEKKLTAKIDIGMPNVIKPLEKRLSELEVYNNHSNVKVSDHDTRITKIEVATQIELKNINEKLDRFEKILSKFFEDR